MIYDPRISELGEGAFWHPTRQQLFWFDILHRRIHTAGTTWEFPQMVSAMGWIDHDHSLVACETGLITVNMNDGSHTAHTTIPANQPATRSNDGRADRQGGFWWGTMGKRGGDDAGMGSIWRYYRGETRLLFPGLTIPNSICFTPDGRHAHFSDTVTHKVYRVALDAQGWPKAEPETFLDLTAEGLYPDGATISADGTIWIAQWGAARVAAYAPDGTFLRAVPVGAPHSSCPAFGGQSLTTLFVTTAQEGMSAEALAQFPDAGRVFATLNVAKGLPEPQVSP